VSRHNLTGIFRLLQRWGENQRNTWWEWLVAHWWRGNVASGKGLVWFED